MKINEITPQITGNAPGKTQQTAETSFNNLLNAKLGVISASKASSPVSAVSSAAPTDSSLRLESLTVTENAINTLDCYGTALKNPSLSTEDLRPFISAMEEETSAILAIREKISGEDPLAGLLDRVATVTYLETAKYHRGDYSN
ncbi:MAG: hypothetical protein J7L69_12870 [Desulfobulbaceae bacterium]|nr:hypothetical protein [Desulfobulbaceae bacterium]